MRPLIIIICAALSGFCSVQGELPSEEAILKTGGEDASFIIDKARSLLVSAEVFASGAVGYGGTPTDTCWALSVVVRFDPKGKEFLTSLYARPSSAVAKLYAAAGLLSLAPGDRKLFNDSLRAAGQREIVIQRMDGCIETRESFGVALSSLLESGPSPYVYPKLPSIYRTTEVRKLPDPKK